MKHRPARLTAVVLVSSLLLLTGWGKATDTSARALDPAADSTPDAPSRLRGNRRQLSSTSTSSNKNAYRDDPNLRHRGLRRVATSDGGGLEQNSALRLDLDGLHNTAALASPPLHGGGRGLETVSDVVVSGGQPTDVTTPTTQQQPQQHHKEAAVAAEAGAMDLADDAAGGRPGKIALTKVAIPQDTPSSSAAVTGPAEQSPTAMVEKAGDPAPAKAEEAAASSAAPVEAAKEPHARPPATYFQRGGNSGNGGGGDGRRRMEAEEGVATAEAPAEAAKEPHLRPPATYFERNRMDAGAAAAAAVEAPAEAAKEPHLPPPATYFERGGSGRKEADDASSHPTAAAAAASSAPGRISLEPVSVPQTPEMAKDPHARPPGTYFERNGNNRGNGNGGN